MVMILKGLWTILKCEKCAELQQKQNVALNTKSVLTKTKNAGIVDTHVRKCQVRCSGCNFTQLYHARLSSGVQSFSLVFLIILKTVLKFNIQVSSMFCYCYCYVDDTIVFFWCLSFNLAASCMLCLCPPHPCRLSPANEQHHLTTLIPPNLGESACAAFLGLSPFLPSPVTEWPAQLTSAQKSIVASLVLQTVRRQYLCIGNMALRPGPAAFLVIRQAKVV